MNEHYKFVNIRRIIKSRVSTCGKIKTYGQIMVPELGLQKEKQDQEMEHIIHV